MNPSASVVFCERRGPLLRTVLAFDLPPDRPVSPSWIGWPAIQQPGPRMKHAGRLTLHRLMALEGVRAAFESESEPGDSVPDAGARCTFYRWWGEEESELLRDRSRLWRLTTFQSRPAVQFPGPDGSHWTRALEPGEATPAGATRIEGGWDHEHCAVCRATISDAAGGQPQAYFSDRAWLCIDCHERYCNAEAALRWGDQV